jgi:mono/diheme cytochrome c family protein
MRAAYTNNYIFVESFVMRSRKRQKWRGVILLAVLCISARFFLPQEAQAQRAQEEFFEARIRPVLATHCFDCHTESPKAGLRLDSRAALLKGGARGPAIIAGNADASLLMQAVTHEHATLRMPKGGPKLTDAAIADLRRWINEGAMWPAAVTAKNPYLIKPEHKSFWSFQPVGKPATPAVKGATHNAVDAFLLAQLESKKLAFNPSADKRTLLRRVTFDLTGLPPTPEEIAAFERDRSPDAFARVVDRLLASPHYGERWARHWLDVARYSDTVGMIDAGRNLQQWFPFAYTYRDWVVRALNEDLPYDQFIQQQLAADKLPNNERKNLAALGFIALSRGGLNATKEERIDDKVDVVTRGLLGLTVSCARCHNHKFDPIPTADYYSLYTIFANVKEPNELPLLDPAASKENKFTRELEGERAKIEKDIAERRQKRYPELKALYRTAPEIAKCLLGVAQTRELKTDKELEKFAQEKDYNAYMLKRWRDYLARQQDNDIWSLWQRFSALPEKEFKARVRVAMNGSGHSLVVKAFKTNPASLSEAADIYGKLLAQYDKPEVNADPQAERLRRVLRAADAPTNVPFADYEKIHLSVDGQDERGKRRKIDNLFLRQAYEGAPPRAQCIEDNPKPEPGFVFVRGNAKNQGEKVEPQFLQILCDNTRQPFTKGRERLELAQAITDKNNPLTARVIVNRVWAWHFGTGLVATPSDFGTRGDAPSHPALLDYLARGFVENGWSLKWLHRQILSSRAYQQSSSDNTMARAVDPENKLLWRFNRRRMDWEELRDTLLSVSGKLDTRLGGLPESAIVWPFAQRRTIYAFLDRALVPNDFRAFDFASPDAHTPQRYLTTVPQQALLMMNAPFTHEQARGLAARSASSTMNLNGRIAWLYQTLYGRAPSLEEIALGQQFIQSSFPIQGEAPQPLNDKRAAWQYGQGDYDEKAGRVTSFKKLPFFMNGEWRNSAMPGDPRDTTVIIHAQGGLPGEGKGKTPIRRWTADFDGRIKLTGSLSHPSCGKCKDRFGYVVSSRAGSLGKWNAQQKAIATDLAEITVQRGDVLDFVVTSGNEHHWPVVIERLDGKRDVWDSVRDFRAPYDQPLTAWERYAQVLLMAAEFMTIE